MAQNDIRTIDNLSIETSIQFEENKAHVDPKLVFDSDRVQASVKLDNFSTTLHSSVSLLFDLDKDTTPVNPPAGFHDQSGRLFTHQLAPNLGPADKIESIEARIEGIKTQTILQITEDPRSQTAIAKKKDVENQAHVLQSLLLTVLEINKGIEFANGERARFKKG
jgi:hypothetical protein